jgi:hypothetical protein
MVLTAAMLAGARKARAQEREYIGVATMLPDGTISIELHLSLPGGGVAEGVKDYKPGDPYYDDVLRHIGGLKVGEHKLVRPWPDEQPGEP